MLRYAVRAMPIRTGLSILSLLLLLSLSSETWSQGLPTAEFVSDRVYVLEDSGIATVQVTLSGMAWAQASVTLATTDDTADISDYVDTSGPVTWNYGQAGIKEFSIQVRIDSDVEPDERFFVDLLPTNGEYIQLGQRTRMEVIILNDDEALRAYFEPANPVRLTYDGRGLYFAPRGAEVAVTVKINAPAPPGFSAEYRLDGGAPLSLLFVEGSTQAVLLVPAPTEPYPGFDFGVREIELVDAAPSKLALNQLFGSYAPDVSLLQCATCLVGAINATLNPTVGCPTECGYDCGFMPPKAVLPAAVDVLRAYRDEVLASTSTGQFYIQLYEQLSPAIVLTMFENGELFHHFNDARGEWIPGFESLVDGEGINYLVRPSMQSSLAAILDDLENSGDAALVEAVQRERSRLMLDSIDGLNMAQLQERLETLVPIAGSSWGSLKARY